MQRLVLQGDQRPKAVVAPRQLDHHEDPVVVDPARLGCVHGPGERVGVVPLLCMPTHVELRTPAKLSDPWAWRIDSGGFPGVANRRIASAMIDEDGIRQRWESIGCKLGERGRRLFAAAEVEAADGA